MESSIVVAVISSGVALLASATACFFAWETSRDHVESKVVELKLAYLTDKRKTLLEALNSEKTEYVDVDADDFRTQIEDNFKFNESKLLKCFGLLCTDEAERLREKYATYCYRLGMLYSGEGPDAETESIAYDIVSFGAEVNNLLRKELIKTTKEIEQAILIRK
jgi:hypothetical protein